MFLVIDLSGKFPYTSKLYDTKDVGDVVIGITGDQADGDLAETMAGYMGFGNEFVSHGRFKLLCIQEEDAESYDSCSVKMSEFIDFYITRRQGAFHDDSDIIDGLLELFSKEELERYGYGDFVKEYFSDREE